MPQPTRENYMSLDTHAAYEALGQHRVNRYCVLAFAFYKKLLDFLDDEAEMSLEGMEDWYREVLGGEPLGEDQELLKAYGDAFQKDLDSGGE